MSSSALSPNIDSTMAQYQTARAKYVQLLKSLYAEQDPDKRTPIMQNIRSQNSILVGIANTLLGQWDTLNRTPATNQTLSELNQDLVQYKQDLETMKTLKDETTKLNMIYANKTGDVAENRIKYFIYIIVVLILLILVFLLFVLRSVMATVVETVLPEPSSGAGV